MPDLDPNLVAVVKVIGKAIRESDCGVPDPATLAITDITMDDQTITIYTRRPGMVIGPRGQLYKDICRSIEPFGKQLKIIEVPSSVLNYLEWDEEADLYQMDYELQAMAYDADDTENDVCEACDKPAVADYNGHSSCGSPRCEFRIQQYQDYSDEVGNR